MGTTREDIKGWIDRRPKGTTHMLVVTDTFDYTDYPVYYGPDDKDSLHEVIKSHQNAEKMSKVMEVYSFTGLHSIETQLAEYRAWYRD